MPTAARKPAAAEPAEDGALAAIETAPAPAAAPEAPPAPADASPEAAEDPESAEPAEPLPAVEVVFNGPIAAVVAGVGFCEPGQVRTVPGAVAAEVCRGEPPLFVRAHDA